MVAVASVSARAREQIAGWLVASLMVLVLGTLLRLAVRPLDVAAASAALLGALLWLGVWLTALMVSTPRAGFWIGLAAMLVLDVAALPARTVVDFDQREALYRPDQTLTLHVPPGSAQLVVLVEPVFDGAQTRFALAGDAGSASVAWSCPMRHGMQRLALPLPAGASTVSLRVIGSPDREREYLIVYTR